MNRSITSVATVALAFLGAVLPPSLSAHPVARRSHDRSITVRLTPTAVIVDYLLEVDEWTVVYVDLPAVSDKVDLAKLAKPEEFREAFRRAYAPILGKNLTLKLDGKEIELRCVRQAHRLAEHLQCEWNFEAAWNPEPGRKHTVTFQEGNYELESGMVRLSLVNHPELPIERKIAPDDALKNRAATELKPGDDENLRKASATFEVEWCSDRAQRSRDDKATTAGTKSAPFRQEQAGSVRRR